MCTPKQVKFTELLVKFGLTQHIHTDITQEYLNLLAVSVFGSDTGRGGTGAALTDDYIQDTNNFYLTIRGTQTFRAVLLSSLVGLLNSSSKASSSCSGLLNTIEYMYNYNYKYLGLLKSLPTLLFAGGK